MDLSIHKLYSSLSPTRSPTTSTSSTCSSLHTSHTSFPVIAVAVIGILATAFLLVSYCIFVIKCCLNWHRIDLLRRFSLSRRRAVEDPLMAYFPAIDNRGLNEAAIRSIPVFKFKKLNTEYESKNSCECAVCLNEFVEGEKLRAIPDCGHVFHIDCIDIWLQNNANCPLCRTSISAALPNIRMPMHQVLGPSPSPQDPSIVSAGDSFTGSDEDYVVIEIGLEQGNSVINPYLPIHEGTSSNELLSNNPALEKLERKVSRKKTKKFSHVSSMGDECIDNRQKDERFLVQPIRRSFSMDSAADSRLYLAVQDIIQRHGQANTVETNQIEACSSSRVKRSFFSFGQGRGSRNTAVVPINSIKVDSHLSH